MDFPEHKPGIGGIRWWHRINLPGTGYTEGIVDHGPDGGDWPTTRFGMPEDLTGKSVIDVGCWDGFFSFEAERRDAEYVMACDCPISEGGNPLGLEGFWHAKAALKSKVDFYPLNIERLPYGLIGEQIITPFDVVLCYGVLYHLKSPFLAMGNLAKLTAPRGICLVETAIGVHAESVLEYYPGKDNDPTNYFYPSVSFMQVVAKQVGFTSCDVIYNKEGRATFRLEKA